MKKSRRAVARPGDAPSQRPDTRSAATLEALARRTVARKPTTPSGHRVKVVLTLFLPHDVAEYITARTIREGKNTAAVIAEILGAESRK